MEHGAWSREQEKNYVYLIRLKKAIFPIPDSRFPIPDSRFPIAYSRFNTSGKTPSHNLRSLSLKVGLWFK
ncbi:MAG: hypothetical protein F6K65_39515 [Moorea sp. SIO3C2]|nr:hypothetical protein [Moorena sp. SIO3C2]